MCNRRLILNMDIIISRGARASSILRSIASVVPTNYFTSIRCVSSINTRHWSTEHIDGYSRHRAVSYNYLLFSNCILKHQKFNKHNINNVIAPAYSSDSKTCETTSKENTTLFQKIKMMTKAYWYIVIPVHLVTSGIWIMIFYTAVKNGLDIVSIIEKWHLSEKYLTFLKKSSAGYWALAYVMYKIFTPLRYTVTIGGTTVAIRYLRKFGVIKNAPIFGVAQTAKKTECNVKDKTQHKTESGKEQAESPKM